MTMYHTATRPTNRLRLIAGLNVAAILCLISPTVSHGQSVTIDYFSSNGTAAIDPITIPNPDTGIDIVVTPSITIDTGGSYRLTGNLSLGLSDTAAIDVSASNVTLDLGGFTIRGTADCTGLPPTIVCTPAPIGDGIRSGNSSHDLVVRDGHLRPARVLFARRVVRAARAGRVP